MKNKLFLANIPYEMGEDELTAFIIDSGFNPLSLVIMRERNGHSKGFGFMLLETEKLALEAIEKLHKKPIGKMKLRISLAEEEKREKYSNKRV